jgi:signal transduction histidine kinase/PAS domain-containing protein
MAKAGGRRSEAMPKARRARLAPQHSSSAEHLELVMRAINEGVYDWDVGRGAIYYSEAVYTVLHMPRSVTTPQGWHTRIHPDDRREYDRRLVEHFKGRRDRFECDYRYRDRHGAWRWARQHGVAVRDARGRAVRMVGSTGDITEMKRVERALKESQDRYALATQAATEGIYEWNLATGSLYLSERAKEFFAVRGKALTPAAWNRRVHKDDFPGYRAALVAFFKNREAKYFEHEYRIRDAAGGYAWIVDRAVAERDGRNRVRRLIGAVGDVTERKQHELELARARDEATAALEQQRASAEVLGAISGSMADTQPVFDRILESCERLFAGRLVGINVLGRDGRLHLGAYRGKGRRRFEKIFPLPADEGSGSGAAIVRGQVVHYADVEADANVPPSTRAGCAALGVKSVIFAPMLAEEGAIGAIFVGRRRAAPFSGKEIELLKGFASQAAISIKNVRLFNETKQALERQTATAEILRTVAGSPTDAQPVLEALAARAGQLTGAAYVNVLLEEGGKLRTRAVFSASGGPRADLAFTMPTSRATVNGRAFHERRVIQVEDFAAVAKKEYPDAVEFQKRFGFRTILGIPMLREGRSIGTLSVWRLEVKPFTADEIALLQTFADQAVIAIENVRLFNGTKEALERQTATAEILKVIASSPTDTQPVFDAIVQSGLKLFAGAVVAISVIEGMELRVVAATGSPGAAAKGMRLPISRESASGMAIVERRVVNIKDTEAPDAPPHARDNGRKLGVRSMTQAPMFREGEAIGVIGVTLKEPGGLDDKQISLLQTFADQAVIAIENVRLFKELQSRTEALTRSVGQLTALGEVGRAVSSTLDLQQVLQTIVQHAVKLTGLDGGSIYEYDEARGRFSLQAAENIEPELVKAVRERPVKRGEGAIGRCAETLEPEQVADIADGSYTGKRKHLLVRAGYRAILAVPLLREDHLLGALQVFSKSPGPFAREVVELMKTFATQSAMAIQNARLYREIAEKGKQLEVASRHKSQFLASMSHELRTPLNAILGFNEMLLGQVYGEVPADMQEPMQDIQKSGKHLLRLINNVLDLAKIEAGRMELALSDYSVQDTVESVRATLRPLAAEKGLEFLASVPEHMPLAYGDSGRITQCLMNLAGNSIKFTKVGKVEIAVAEEDGLLTFRVTDTGVGIPPEKIDSLFTEFKQTDATIASEYGGTGLGLSISKKFVEMHGGRIWIESELGRGSSFIFELPLRALARA